MNCIVDESHFGARLLERLAPNMFRTFKEEMVQLVGQAVPGPTP